MRTSKFLVAVLIAAVGGSSALAAGATKEYQLTPKVQRGKNSEIAKKKLKPNDPKATPPKAVKRGSEPGVCIVQFTNMTPWAAFVLVDGQPRGMVGGNGDTYLAVTGTGTTIAAAFAQLSNDDVVMWGPQEGNCPDGGIASMTLGVPAQ